MTDAGEDATRHTTGGFLAERALIRPVDDRKIAGVCAGLGRFTGTDPLLWRVTLGVLIVVSGAGLVLYVVGWLLIPSEGDQASAVESLFTRKTSSVPKMSTVAMLVAAVTLCVITFAGSGGRPYIIFALMVLVVAALARRRDQLRTPPAASPAPGYQAPGYQAPLAADGRHAQTSPTAQLPVTAPTAPRPEVGATSLLPESGTTSPVAPPPVGAPQPAGAPPSASAPQPAKRRQPRSRFGLVMGSFTVIVVSVLAIVSMQGAPITFATILTVGLLMCGGGLLVATWWGRARGLILLGLPMALVLAVYGVVFAMPEGDAFQDRRIEPASVEEIPPRVATVAGLTTVRMSGVDFEDDDRVTIDVEVRGAMVHIALPEEVDVVVETQLLGGHVNVGGQSLDPRSLPAEFHGPDGAGGGEVVLTGQVYPGALEVTR